MTDRAQLTGANHIWWYGGWEDRWHGRWVRVAWRPTRLGLSGVRAWGIACWLSGIKRGVWRRGVWCRKRAWLGTTIARKAICRGLGVVRTLRWVQRSVARVVVRRIVWLGHDTYEKRWQKEDLLQMLVQQHPTSKSLFVSCSLKLNVGLLWVSCTKK